MSIASLVFRINGIVAYADGSKSSFAGAWDGRVDILPGGAPETVAAQATFDDVMVIDAINTVMSENPNPTTTDAVVFHYSPSLIPLPAQTPLVSDLSFSFSGLVAYSDGSKDSFEVTYQKGIVEASSPTNKVLNDIIADSAAHAIVNSVLTSTVGFTLTLAHT